MSNSQNSSRATGSTPDVGSSRISISGSWITATASESRWRTPSGIDSGRSSRYGPSPKRSTSSSMRDRHRLGRQMIQPRVEPEVLPHRQLAVEREGLRHVTDALPDLEVLGVDRLAEQLRLAFRSGQQAGQHLHRRRLAAAVGAEEAEDLAALDREIHLVHRHEVAEPARQVPGVDGRLAAVGLDARRNGQLRCRFAALLLGQQGDEGLFQVLGAGPLLELRRACRWPGPARHPSRSIQSNRWASSM